MTADAKEQRTNESQGSYVQRRGATVLRVVEECEGLQELLVRVDGGGEDRAVNYPLLTGRAVPGSRVVLNTGAVALGLGSGGYHFVYFVYGAENADYLPGGHIMKLRYTPWQLKVHCGEENLPGRGPLSLAGMPVVVCSLHSQVVPVCLAIRRTCNRARVAYIMTDGGALPLWFSRSVHRLRTSGVITQTLTCGHAFGGEIEAVNVYSALALARHVAKADITVIGMGPGIAGTGTALGFSGVEQAYILDAVSSLCGRAVACLRLGQADKRPRHYGVSHHSLTILGYLTHSRVYVPLPVLPRTFGLFVEAQLKRSGIWYKHQIERVAGGDAVLRATGWPLSTMGRGPQEEPSFFRAAAAAGLLAGRLHRQGFPPPEGS